MRKCFYLILIFTFIWVSCENKDENPSSELSDMTITVYNAEDWSPVSPLPVCSGALVKLVSVTNTLTDTTNSEGKAVFENFEIDMYSLEVTKDNLSNIIDKDGSGKGFIAIAIFQSQSEVDTYTDLFGDPMQPGAVPGDLKIDDLNNDLKIDDKDRVSVTHYIPYVDINDDLFVNELDMVDGAYVVKENLDMDVYIGN